jgi:hypothetical protein
MKYRIKELTVNKNSTYYPQERCFFIWKDIIDMGKDAVCFQTIEEATYWIDRKVQKNKQVKSTVRYYPYEPEG